MCMRVKIQLVLRHEKAFHLAWSASKSRISFVTFLYRKAQWVRTLGFEWGRRQKGTTVHSSNFLCSFSVPFLHSTVFRLFLFNLFVCIQMTVICNFTVPYKHINCYVHVYCADMLWITILGYAFINSPAWIGNDVVGKMSLIVVIRSRVDFSH